MVDLSVMLRRITDLAALIAGKPDLHGAVVTGTSPLEIQLDAAPAPLQGSPSTLVSGLQIGDRVLVAMQNHRARVIGRMTGYPLATADTPGVITLPATGVITPSPGTTITKQHLSKDQAGIVTLIAYFSRGSNIAHTQALGTIPAAFWPAEVWSLPGSLSLSTAYSASLRIGTDGALSYLGTTSNTNFWVCCQYPSA